jgi:type IV pilus assembly protein PilB
MMKLSRSVRSTAGGSTATLVDDRDQAPDADRAGSSTERLGNIVVELGYATRKDVEAAAIATDGGDAKLLGRRLVEQRSISETQLARALAAQFKLGMIDLGRVTPKPEALSRIDELTARSLLILPISVHDGTVRVAVADPTPQALWRVREKIGSAVTAEIAPLPDLTAAIGHNYRALAGIDNQVHAFEARDSLRRDAARIDATATVDDEAPVVQVTQKIITQALRDRASDIHIEPNGDRIRVRFRIDGALTDALDLPGSIGPALVSRVKILADMNIVERRRPQDGQISIEIEGREVDIRVASAAVVGGEKVVMRLLDKSRPLYELDRLGMPEDTVERYTQILRMPYGMVVCAGPTGSGKTTTLYGSIGHLNSPDKNIMTIEDPVEYTFSSINQIQINEQAGITFSTGLKSILRQDPDVILVGEIRDVETARIAVQSALTGHFVLSSVHATDSVAALHRLLDMGIEGFLVSSSLSAVVAQRLVRRNCHHCEQAYRPSAEELAFLETVGGAAPKSGFKRGTGCNFCADTGYLERIGVYELLVVTDEIRDLIIHRGSHEELRRVCREQGMRTLTEEATRLIEAGVTTPAEVMRSIFLVGA